MEVVSATEAKQTFGAVLDKAQSGPVIIRKQNRDVAVIMSMTDYQRLTMTNLQEFREFRKNLGLKAGARGLTEDKLKDILATD